MINRYTSPRAQELIKSIDWHDSHNIFLSLYPHLCHSTVVSSFRDFDVSYKSEYQNLDFYSQRIYSWWHHPSYLQMTADDLLKTMTPLLEKNPKRPLHVLFSAHGLPAKYAENGDPYVEETKSHYQALSQMIVNHFKNQVEKPEKSLHFHLSFQSRVGPMQWTKPYTEDVIEQHAKSQGDLLLVPISFTSDHIETLYEMDVTYKELALKKGFQSYCRVSPPNGQNQKFIHCLADIIEDWALKSL